MPRKRKRARAVKIMKIIPLTEDKHLVELEVAGVEPPPIAVAEPMEILVPGPSRKYRAPEASDSPLVKWLKSWW